MKHQDIVFRRLMWQRRQHRKTKIFYWGHSAFIFGVLVWALMDLVL